VLGAGQSRYARITRVAINNSRKAGPGDEFHQLGEKRLAKIHDKPPKKSIWGNYSQNGIEIQIGTN
jgi:hypothetical protein